MAVLVIAHSEGGLLDSGVYACVTAALEISDEVDNRFSVLGSTQ